MEKDKVKYHALEVFDGFGKEVGVFPVQKEDNVDVNIKCTLLHHKRDPQVHLGNVTLPGNETLTAYVNSMTITVKNHNNTVIKVKAKNIESLDTIVLYSTNDPFSKPVIFDRRKV